jgi:transcriptional regulator with XRE-family HTH domain
LQARRDPDTFPDVEMFDFIGETLRRLRKEHHLTLDELGEAAELGRGQLSRIENHKQEATLSTLAKILKCQGVSRREFFRRYDLVESEARAVKRQEAGGALAEGEWPEEIRQVLSKIESVVQLTVNQPRPVAQGALEVGEWVVLFRVVSKDGGVEPAPALKAKAEGEGDGPRRRKPGRPGVPPGRKRKR